MIIIPRKIILYLFMIFLVMRMILVKFFTCFLIEIEINISFELKIKAIVGYANARLKLLNVMEFIGKIFIFSTAIP